MFGRSPTTETKAPFGGPNIPKERGSDNSWWRPSDTEPRGLLGRTIPYYHFLQRPGAGGP